jgi:hypothetical protein
MNTKTETLVMKRLREIMPEDELALFVNLPQFKAVSEAAENGWPFMLSKQPHGGYNLLVQKTGGAAV